MTTYSMGPEENADEPEEVSRELGGDLALRHAELNELILRHLALLEVLRRRAAE